MKNIGIFGDSYASSNDVYHPNGGLRQGKNGWSALIQADDPENVDIYAEPGASFDWAFQQFLKHHAEYKQNIFVMTSINRIYKPIHLTGKTDKTRIYSCPHWPSARTIELMMQEYTRNDITDIIYNTHVFIYNNRLSNDIQICKQAAIATYIRTIRPDTILIPAIPAKSQLLPYVMGEYTWSLHDIEHNEYSKFWRSITDGGSYDCRVNHMTFKSNRWVYEHVKARLRGEFIDWNPSLTPQYNNPTELFSADT